jgi:hypothetical protein
MSISNASDQGDSNAVARRDRRRRHSDNPATPITVNIPVSLKNALDAVVVERNGTRSGIICMAVTEWLERHDTARHD